MRVQQLLLDENLLSNRVMLEVLHFGETTHTFCMMAPIGFLIFIKNFTAAFF
jgi:hypothetical protein